MEPVRINCHIGSLLLSRKGGWLRIVACEGEDLSKDIAIVYLTKSEVEQLVKVATELSPRQEFGSGE